jgi:hypothetical protein
MRTLFWASMTKSLVFGLAFSAATTVVVAAGGGSLRLHAAAMTEPTANHPRKTTDR